MKSYNFVFSCCGFSPVFLFVFSKLQINVSPAIMKTWLCCGLTINNTHPVLAEPKCHTQEQNSCLTLECIHPFKFKEILLHLMKNNWWNYSKQGLLPAVGKELLCFFLCLTPVTAAALQLVLQLQPGMGNFPWPFQAEVKNWRDRK